MTRLGAGLIAGVLAAACSPAPAPVPDNREAAYRENNRGVAELEQYAYDKAVESFRRAIALDDRVALPYVNLPIALYYASNLEEADRAAAAADTKQPNSAQVAFLRGLIARAMNRGSDAEAAFKRVLALDADDAASMINLGQLYLQDRKTDEAIAMLRAAVSREPANATAHYVLGQALIRSGARADGARETSRFEALRDSGAGVTYSQAYLEQGRHAEALISTGLEPDLVSRATPNVHFSLSDAPVIDGTEQPAAVVLSDVDLDADLDLLAGTAKGVRLFRATNGRLEDASQSSGLSTVAESVSGMAIGDLDNDGRPDLLLLHPLGIATQRQAETGTFSAFARQPSIALRPDAAALLDADHDGDLDILVGGQPSTPAQSGLVLLRNDGRGVFTDITKTAGLTSAGRMVAIAPIDFDNRRDVDILAISETGAVRLFQNQRDGSFRDVAADVGLTALTGSPSALTTCDLNKDGFADFIAATASAPLSLALSDGHTRFTSRTGPDGSRGVKVVQCADYDNDGLLDIVGAGADGFKVFRNLGTDLIDVTTTAAADSARAAAPVLAFALGDVDVDGDIDAAVATATGVRILRNDGGSSLPSIRVGLTGRVSNRSGVGARVDIRAGSLWQRLDRLSASPPIGPETPTIGLGSHGSADAVRVLWPAGILQAEATALPKAITVVELDRKPSSCPFLYTWNGKSFEFITDFLGGGELGYWEAPGRYNQPDPDEFVRVTDQQLEPRDGLLDLRVTNELEEVLYLDQLQLLSVDHPAGVEIYPREGMRTAARQGLSLVAVRNIAPVARAWSDGGEELTPDIAARDGRYSTGFVPRSIRGYAETHDLLFELPHGRARRAQVLLLTGWTDYAFSSDNVAAAQRGWVLDPPRLDIRTRDGAWRTLVADVGIPVGRPQTLVADIGAAVEPGTQFRLRTNMRVHWDVIAVGEVADDVNLTPRTHALVRADLHWRGYSSIDDSRIPAPAIPDYLQVLMTSPWKLFAGRYTREGDVRPLMQDADDLFVTARSGDELAVAFDSGGPPAARRTYLLGGVGFSKEMDMNSASPDVVLPLPARGLTRYPAAASSADTRARQRDAFERYNTRIVARQWSRP